MKINNFNAAPVNNKNNSQPVTFKGEEVKSLGEITKNGCQKLLTLDRSGTMSRNLFIMNAFAFLLGTRLITSRDKDEKREILIRDVPSIIIAVVGVPTIQNFISKKMQKSPKHGFVFMDIEKNPKLTDLQKWLNKHLGFSFKPKEEKLKSIKYSQLKDLYQYDENISSGLEGFSKRLADKGGNVKKIYSVLNLDKVEKEKLAALKGDNDSFIKELTKDENNKGLVDSIINELKSDKNAALKRAETLKTIPTIVGFATTLGLLGFFIPKLNIYITETINKKRNAEIKSDDSNTKQPNKVS